MGSLSPQGQSNNGGGSSTSAPIITSGQNEAYVTSTAYTNALIVNLENSIDHIIQIKNTSATATIDYKVYASPKVGVSAPVDVDDSWFNVLNGTDPATYLDSTKKTIPISGIVAEGLSNRFAWLRVQVKASVGTPTIKIWVRGTSL